MTDEISEGKLARLALVGAIVLGISSGSAGAAQVSNREINSWKRDFNSLTVKDKKRVLGMIDEGKKPKSFKQFMSNEEMMTTGDAGIPQDTSTMMPKKKKKPLTRHYIEVMGTRRKITK